MKKSNASNSRLLTGPAGAIWCLLIVITLALTGAANRPEDAKSDNKLVGTWKLVSANYGGQESTPPEGVTTLKHVTPTQFLWASYDKNGKITRAAGGGYTIKGDAYEETPQYGMSEDFELIKDKAQTFKWKVEGNKWYHTGKLSNGLTIDEVWERH